MADSAVDKTETNTPVEKEVVEKPVSTVEVGDEDSKQSENGDTVKNGNGKAPAKDDEESKDGEIEDDSSTDAHDACPVKRKSTGGGDASEGSPVEGASPEKKAKLESADNGAAEENGAEAKVAA